MTTKTSSSPKTFECQECHTKYASPREECLVCGGGDVDVLAPADAPKAAKRCHRCGNENARELRAVKGQRGVYCCSAQLPCRERQNAVLGYVASAEQILDAARPDERQVIGDEADADSEPGGDDGPEQPAEEAALVDERDAAERAADTGMTEAEEQAAGVPPPFHAEGESHPERDPAENCPRCGELRDMGYVRAPEGDVWQCYGCGLNLPDGTELLAPRESPEAPKKSSRRSPGTSSPPNEPAGASGSCPTCHVRNAQKGDKPCHVCWLQAKVDRGAALTAQQAAEVAKLGLASAAV